MTHQPGRIAEALPPYAIALAERARDGRMVVYAGAGISMSQPAGLPSGADVARRLYLRLKDVFPEIERCDPDQLTSVADAVAARPGGMEALRQTAPRIAEFTTATPGYSHRMLALLLLEGVVDVLTTNWDDCVERSGGTERVSAVVTEADLIGIPAHSLLKIHGCATQPASLLLTTEHLDTPPTWVAEQTRSRLGTSVVAFVGIGDVAGYVKRRIDEVIAGVGNVDNVRVVNPEIGAEWDSSAWAALIPGLAPEHRIEATADAFLEHIGSGYVHVVLADLAAAVGEEERLGPAAVAATDAIKQHHALHVLLWARGGGVVSVPGKPVLDSETMSRALLALGLLLPDGFEILRDGFVVSGEDCLDVLVAVGTQPSSRLRREAQNRLEHHLSRGLDPPRFLVAGGIGWPTSTHGAAPFDVIGSGHADDLIDGPLSPEPAIVRAEEVTG